MKVKIITILAILVMIICHSQSTDSLRILGLFPLNGRSHFIVCEELLKELAERGHQVDVYSHNPLKKSIPNYKDFSLEGTLPNTVNNISYDFVKNFDTPNVKNLIPIISNPVCELMNISVFQELFENLKKNQPYDVVLVELFLSNCFLAWGRHLNIPMVGIMTSTLIDWFNEPLGNPMNTAIHPGWWSGLFHPMSFWERLINTVSHHVTTMEFNYYIKDQNKYVEKFFGPGYPDVSKLPQDIDLLLLNTHYAIEGIRAYTPSIVPIAGLHIVDDGKKLPNDIQNWLDGSKNGCIYISFGSMVRFETFPKSVIDAFYVSFRNLANVRFLMKIAKPEELPPGLPSNVMVKTWFPQIKILNHRNTKGFVTHGGVMSLIESTYAGVPLIGVPIFADQKMNVQAQFRRKAAPMIDVVDITNETLTVAIKKVLTDPIYKKNAERFSREITDRPMKPMDTAIFWIEYIVRHGKGSLRSPIVDMPWYQAHLIDVYGFILLSIIILTYLLILIFKILKAVCCSKYTQQQRKKVKKN